MKSSHKIVGILSIVLSMIFLFSGMSYAGETFEIDPVHSHVGFRVKHLGIAFVYGRFNNPSGSFVFDGDSPEKSAIDMRVAVADIDTGNAKRDTHLKSPDFFDADKYPEIAFKSVSIKKTGDDSYDVSGDLTFHGATRQITVPAKFTGSGKDPWGGFRSGFEAAFTIKRSDYGMAFMLGGVGDMVELAISVEGKKK